MKWSLALLLAAGLTFAPRQAVDAEFAAFWAASSPSAAAQLVDRVAASGVTFDDAYRRLHHGRPYTAQPTGVVRLTSRTALGVDHNYVLNVPETYDSSRTYQVRFQLHGGVMNRRDNRAVGAGTIGALAGAEQIYVIPYAWAASPWWSDDEVLNLRDILDATKRAYNVDENRVVVSGVSDGGTGAYYLAMRETTPYAAFLPLNGFLMVLANRDLQIREPLYPNNLRSKPLFVVNGGRDPLYPTEVVDPFIDHFKKGGVSVAYHPQPDAGHNTQWWPEVKDRFEAFVREHPREPLPDTLTWESDGGTSFNRSHWLVIDRLGAQKSDARDVKDLNVQALKPAPDFGARSTGMRVHSVIPGSNAARLGLKVGDAILRLNDEPVHGYADIAEFIRELKPGTPITLLVARDNLPVELTGTYDPQLTQLPPRQLFDRSVPSGRVDLVRKGNTIEAATRGVAVFTLLLSPDQFDFGKPVKVIANGRSVFDGRVKKDLRTLLKWAAADNDRTMLFAAELRVDLTR